MPLENIWGDEGIMTHILVFLLAFGASVVGAVCGIGGGVIIKPLLDALGIAGASQISFLSGCTVLSMSCYSVIWAMAAKESLVKFDTGTPLAIGAAIGGIVGKSLFSALTASVERQETVGGYQAVFLTIMTGATFLYTINKSRIQTLHIKDTWICILVGLALGMMSSFLGIGGGPINLVVLYFFFSMGTKAAAQNSLYIILVSQVTSLLTSLITNSVPPFRASWLLQMVSGGIGGGIVGRKINKRLLPERVDRLFLGLLVVIIGICCYNAWRFL